MKIVIVGGEGGTNIGDSFRRAAVANGWDVTLFNCRRAFSNSRWLQRISWHLLDHRPAHLGSFSATVESHIAGFGVDCFITTGLAPVLAATLDNIGRQGIKRMCFLTDDPWNPTHSAKWFFKALPFYDIVFSPRKANIADLRSAGCKRAEYLPFAYDPELFFPERTDDADRVRDYRSDVVFAGGADADRVPYMSALIEAGFNLSLYGSYWERFSQTRKHTKGQASVSTVRMAMAHAKICLCLVRRQNRDGNCMRTFEVPAVGSCMLCEYTEEHREIFGADGQAVVYFSTINEMVDKTQWLLAHPEERNRIARSGHLLITRGEHTYADRLKQMLNVAC